MLGLQCTAYGSPPSLSVNELSERALVAGEVRIAVGAIGLGYFDSVLLSGRYQEKPSLPLSIGRELSGHIVEVGPEVDAAMLGRLVACIGYQGACVERAIAREAHCIYLPAGYDAVAGASIPSAYGTALFALQDCGKLMPDERVLILGAAGTVGTAAIHVTQALGGRAIAMASSAEKRAHCLDAGAEFVIDGSQPDWRKTLAEAVEKVDVVVDSVGGALSEAAFRCLAPGGRHLVVGFASGEIPRLPLNLCLLKRASAVGVDLGGHMQQEPEASRELLARLTAMLASGKLRPAPTSVHSMHEIGDVLLALVERRNIGKPVIRVDGWPNPSR